MEDSQKRAGEESGLESRPKNFISSALQLKSFSAAFKRFL
jgi:hypothetical protein